MLTKFWSKPLKQEDAFEDLTQLGVQY